MPSPPASRRTIRHIESGASDHDAAEVAIFSRYLIEAGAHKRLVQMLGCKLPFDTVSVPHEWWDPEGKVPRRFQAQEDPDVEL